MDGNSHLVRASGSSATGVIENGILALSERLQSWATFDEHLAGLGSSGISLTGRELARALEPLQKLGAFWFADDFLNTLRTRPSRPAAPIHSLVWCTRDRPKELARSVGSFLSKGFDSSPPRVIVCDDSTDPDAVQQTAEALETAAREWSLPPERLFHVSMAAKRRIITALKELVAPKGISPEVVKFILYNEFHLPYSEGANRNFALLLTAGEAFLSSDDDTLAEGAYGDAPEELELSSDFNPMVTDFFANDEQCSKTVLSERCDVQAQHKRFLGKGVGDILKDFEGRDVMLSSCAGSFSKDLASCDGSIVMTAAGALGDSGFGSPRLVFQLDGEQRDRYVGDIQAYEALRLSRIVFRRAMRPVISNSPWLVAMNHAVDNREFIPPTFPFGRNSDGLLGVLLRACRPDACILYLPFGIRHIPPASRAFSESDLHTFAPRVCDFIGHLAQAARLNPLMRSPADRVSTLATWYQALGNLSLQDFEEATRSFWMSFIDRYISNMEARLDQYGHSPGLWVADVERYIESLLEFLRTPAPILPREFRTPADAGSSGGQLESFRQSVRLYGEALAAWPTLREIARQQSFLTSLARD